MYSILSRGKVLLIQNTIPTFNEFLNVMGVQENCFASDVLHDIYDELYVFSIDLLKEYNTYYSIEYKTFLQFYINKVGGFFDRKLFLEFKSEPNHVLLIKTDMHLIDTDYEENYLETTLQALGRFYEN